MARHFCTNVIFFDLFLLLFASRGSSAAREADEIMMQMSRKFEIICDNNYYIMLRIIS